MEGLAWTTMGRIAAMGESAGDRVGGVWSIGRVQVGSDREPWVIDVVLDEARRVRALSRWRPTRGRGHGLGDLIDRAITSPLVGRVELPARVRVGSVGLMLELAEHPVALEVELAPTPEIDRAAQALAPRYLPPEERWSWLGAGVSVASARALFEQLYLFATTFAWFTLCGREPIRVHLPGARLMHLRLEATRRIDGELDLALHVAPDADTLAAWSEGLRGERQITIAALEPDELPRQALEELERICGRRRDLYPRVIVGIERRAPSADEVATALVALEAFNALHDHGGPTEGLQVRTLASGATAEIEVLEPVLSAFPDNDDGITIEAHTAESRARMLFLDRYLSGAFDRKAGAALTC